MGLKKSFTDCFGHTNEYHAIYELHWSKNRNTGIIVLATWKDHAARLANKAPIFFTQIEIDLTDKDREDVYLDLKTKSIKINSVEVDLTTATDL